MKKYECLFSSKLVHASQELVYLTYLISLPEPGVHKLIFTKETLDLIQTQ